MPRCSLGSSRDTSRRLHRLDELTRGSRRTLFCAFGDLLEDERSPGRPDPPFPSRALCRRGEGLSPPPGILFNQFLFMCQNASNETSACYSLSPFVYAALAWASSWRPLLHRSSGPSARPP